MSLRNSIHWTLKVLLEREEPWQKRRRNWLASIDRIMRAKDVPPAVLEKLAWARSRGTVYMSAGQGQVLQLRRGRKAPVGIEWALRWDRALYPSSPVWRWLKIMADRVRLVRPPGYSLFRAAEFLCAARTADLIFRPLLSDIEIEYCEALAQQRWLKAAYVKLRGQWSLITALVALSPKWVLRAILRLHA
jgi:hypothetical protein